MSTCPNCGRKLRLTDWRPNCRERVILQPKLFHGSYRKTCIAIRIMDIILPIVPAALGLTTKAVGTWWKPGLLFAAFGVLLNINDGPANVLEGEIGREISDYTEYMTGEWPDGTIGLLTDLVGKVTQPLNALFTIFIFRWTGYDPNIIPYFFYGLEGKKKGMYAALNERRAMIANSDGVSAEKEAIAEMLGEEAPV